VLLLLWDALTEHLLVERGYERNALFKNYLLEIEDEMWGQCESKHGLRE
jgi:hypothetical protein